MLTAQCDEHSLWNQFLSKFASLSPTNFDILNVFTRDVKQKTKFLRPRLREMLVAWHSGRNVGLWLANFPCPALDLQLMSDH